MLHIRGLVGEWAGFISKKFAFVVTVLQQAAVSGMVLRIGTAEKYLHLCSKTRDLGWEEW